METCREFEELIDRELAEGVAPAERERLLEHLDRCAACSELFDLVRSIRSDFAGDEPTEHERARLRRAVMAALPARRRGPAPATRPGAQPAWARTALAAGAAVALVGAGLWLGRASARPAAPLAGVAAGEPLDAGELRRAGYRFSSVDVEEAGANRLRLSFDVSRAVEVEVDRRDPLVTEVLVESLVAPAELGSRLRAVESAGERIDPRVRRALIEVMRRDESVGVRLAAQEKLLATGRDPEVVDALLGLLREEESVQMRLAAIDYLTENRIDAGRIESAIESGRSEGSRALYVHARSYLNDRAAARSSLDDNVDQRATARTDPPGGNP
jgi:hypothetical protein